MAKLFPFKALRPTRDKVHLVATRPYYSYKKGVLKAKLQSNPYTFLRIINPEFGIPKEERHHKTQQERFEMVKEKYAEFIANGILFKEEQESLYLYRQTVDNHSYTGIITGASVDEYLQGKIKKHEATITAREQMFVEYLDIVEYNAEPVLLCHSSSKELDEVYSQIIQHRPEYEFTTTDEITHEVWPVSGEKLSKIVEIFENIEALYIADGHHRSASSSGLYERRKNENRSDLNDQYFLSFLIDEKKIKIFEYNRLVRLNKDIPFSQVLSDLHSVGIITELSELRTPNNEHEVILVTKDQQFSIALNPEGIEFEHPVESLDAQILTKKVLSPILGIHDLKTDPNIDFIAGVESLEKIKKKMIKNNFDLAFILYPVDFEQVKMVADANMIMPPKSTWVEPKMRSGLTIYQLNEKNGLR